MIFNQWYIILESRELKKGKSLRIKRLNIDLALWRDQDRLRCVALPTNVVTEVPHLPVEK